MQAIFCCCFFAPFIFQEEEANHLKGKMKEFEEERGRFHRTNAALQTQIEKYKNLAEEARSKSESQELQLTALRKVSLVLLLNYYHTFYVYLCSWDFGI